MGGLEQHRHLPAVVRRRRAGKPALGRLPVAAVVRRHRASTGEVDRRRGELKQQRTVIGRCQAAGCLLLNVNVESRPADSKRAGGRIDLKSCRLRTHTRFDREHRSRGKYRAERARRDEQIDEPMFFPSSGMICVTWKILQWTGQRDVLNPPKQIANLRKRPAGEMPAGELGSICDVHGVKRRRCAHGFRNCESSQIPSQRGSSQRAIPRTR